MTHEEAVKWANGVLAKHLEKGCRITVKQPGCEPFFAGYVGEGHVIRVAVQHRTDGTETDPHFWLSWFREAWPENAYTGTHLAKIVRVEAGAAEGVTRLITDDDGFLELAPLQSEREKVGIEAFREEMKISPHLQAGRDAILAEHREWADRWERPPDEG